MKESFLLASLAIGIVVAPAPLASAVTITVSNPLGQARQAETISLVLKQLPAAVRSITPASLRIRDASTHKLVVSQLVDVDSDGQPDELLFQTDIAAHATQKFLLSSGTEPIPTSPVTTYARFVPERTDDFAWENDRVAFRTYGPVAEQLYDKKDPNGTLSSGMDCWLKRVPYPIIDKWYGRHVHEKPFAYHTDLGEGYDPYHVGSSRGDGGTGVLEDDSLYTSRNFTSYKIIATGPIRTIFKLTYAPWKAGKADVQEEKTISLDLGSNLTRYEEHITSTSSLPNCTIGLTLHENRGEVKADQHTGWFSYWEKIGDSYLGTAVVIPPHYLTDYQRHVSSLKDHNQLYMVTKPQRNIVAYYAGFGWQKSGQFTDATAWRAYLLKFANRIAHPLIISYQ